MNSLRQKPGGYTIVELMIVLVISAALFATAIVGYSRQNSRTQFTQSVREFELKIQDVLNDVETGYYPNQGNLRCVRSGGAAAEPIVSRVDGTDQGTNNDCIFIGRGFNLADNGDDLTHGIFTIVGLSYKSTDAEELSTNVEDAANRLIADPAIPGSIETYTHHGSINVLKTIDTATNTTLDGFAIISGFGDARNRVSIAKVEGYSLGSAVVDNSDLNRVVTVCIEESGGGSDARRATIKIGDGSLSNIETTVDISDADWAAGCGA